MRVEDYLDELERTDEQIKEMLEEAKKEFEDYLTPSKP